MRDLGLMVNYRCNARCAHCLYASSPTRDEGYMTEKRAEKVARMLDDYNISAVHIGGGEPFLDFDGLLMVLGKLWDHDIDVDYIETNGFWCLDRKSAVKKLAKIKELRGNCVMISCDPFHAEYIPPKRTLEFIEECEAVGIDHFVWKDVYLAELSRSGLDIDRPSSVDELKLALGSDYRTRTAANYGMAFNGRALGLLAEMVQKRPAEEVAQQCDGRQLRKMDRGHIDMRGVFIPGHCLGFGVDFVWLMEGAKSGRYRAIDMIRDGGLSQLFKFAVKNGFVPDPSGYVSPCALCIGIKKFLLGGDLVEIYPADFFGSL